MNIIESIFPSHFAEALGWMVLHSLWQGVAAAFLAALALIALRNRPAMLRYRVANLALAATLVAAAGTFFYYYDAPTAPAVLAQETIEQVAGSLPLPSQTFENQLAPLEPAQTSLLDAATWQAYFSPHLPLIVLFWFIGMSVFLLRLLGNFACIHYFKNHLSFPVESYWEEVLQNLSQRAGIRKTVQLLESALVRTPLMVGYLKPVILFPVGMINRLDPKEAEAILAHELAHILHHDYLLNFLQTFVETLFYFHPAIWWLSAKIRQEREMAADDAAIRLTGNSVAYAKTLVMVQEMAFARMPEGVAFAFAGTRKSQLFHRIQRILNIKSSKNFNMEKIVGTLAVVLVLIGLGYSQTTKTIPPAGENSTQTAVSGDGLSGVWQANIEDGKVCITLTSRRDGGSWMSGDCFAISDFSALPKGQEGEFTMTRPAGKMTFTGKFEGNEGYGKFTFAPDKTFADWLTQQGIAGIGEEEMIHLFFAGTDKAYVNSLKQVGYDKISGEDLVNLSIHEVDAGKIQAYHNLSKKLGEGRPSIETMVNLSIHEVTPEYAAQLADMGFVNLSSEDVMNYKIHEITPEYAKQVKAMGFPNANQEDVMNFKIHEITPEYLQELKKAGLTNLSAEEVLNMKIHEVSPEKVEAFRKMGFTNLSHEDILNLQIHEVDPKFLEEMKSLGFKNLSAEDAVNLRIHEVSAEYVAELKKAGFSDLSMEDVVNCKIHEVTAAYVNELRQGGFDKLSAEDVMNCKIHEVSPANLKGFEQLGFKNINVEDAINLHIHEVTPEFIKKMQDKGFKDMSLEEYINLKVQFGDKMK